MFMNMKRIINFSSSFLVFFTMFFCILLVGVFPFFIKGIHFFIIIFFVACCFVLILTKQILLKIKIQVDGQT